MKKKPTYKLPVSICAIVLAAGAVVLAVLMETRQMAPPRKYEVDMSGEVIGIDNGPKTPVLTEEETKEEPVIVPDVPEGQTDPAPVVRTPAPEIKKPVIDKVEN